VLGTPRNAMSLKQGGCLRGCVEEVQCACSERSLRREAYNNSVSLCSPGFRHAFLLSSVVLLPTPTKDVSHNTGYMRLPDVSCPCLEGLDRMLLRSKGNLRRYPKNKYHEIRIVSQDTRVIAASGVGSSKCVRRNSKWTRLEGDNANSCTI
jgi:hypothetical protein